MNFKHLHKGTKKLFATEQDATGNIFYDMPQLGLNKRAFTVILECQLEKGTKAKKKNPISNQYYFIKSKNTILITKILNHV